MPDENKTAEFLQKLAPCIERSDLDACVEGGGAGGAGDGRGDGETFEV